MATRRVKNATQENPVSENTESTTTAEVDAVSPPTSPYTDAATASPDNDKVEGSNDIEVPEGASRAHGAAIKRYNESVRRLTKLDARAAKAEQEYRETQELLNSRRPQLVADVAAAQVDIDYHANRKAAVDKALAGAQARAAGHPEDAPDNAGDDDTDVVDGLDDATGTPTNAGHVVFE